MVFNITWWSLRSIIASNFVSLCFLNFGMLIGLASLNGYFHMCNYFVMCSNHLRLMLRKKVFCSSSPLGVMFLSLDLLCLYTVMSTCGLAIMLVIF